MGDEEGKVVGEVGIAKEGASERKGDKQGKLSSGSFRDSGALS